MVAQTESRYICRQSDILGGEPTILGTRIPVRTLVNLWRLGTPPEEIPTQYPQLTLAQVFDALSFYLDNKEEVNSYIEKNHIPDALVHPLVRKALDAD